MGDLPSAEALLQAMAATLSDQVVPATSGGAQHSARVVANLCRILARETTSPNSAGIDDAIRTLLDTADENGSADDRNPTGALDARLRNGDAEFAERALPILRLDVERRLAISKPSYLHDDLGLGPDVS